jgi:8-oxo-dGTP pyrophosphatase MutT (NUDIX family)
VTAPSARAVRPRDAASLILIRHAEAGAEVLMGRRPPRSAFAPDVFVFPGGRLERADFDTRPSRPLDPACARRAGATPKIAQALACAAVRETVEETGLTLGDPAAPDLSSLTLLARAITPSNSPIRFHARFFMTDAANAQGELGGDDELADLAFRPLPEALRLPLFDITEALLRTLLESAGRAPDPYLFAYRSGRPALRPLP